MILAALVLFQAQASVPPSGPITAPILPPATRPEFAEVCKNVELALSKGDFGAAQEAAKLFPKRSFVLGWNDGSVPKSMRAEVVQMRDFAIKSWSRIHDYKVQVAATGDVNVKFADVLPNGKQGIPAAAVIEYGSKPRLSVTIGLRRGNPPEQILPADVFPQIARAIGAYLGVADNPLATSAMHVDDSPDRRVFGPKNTELYVASGTLQAADILRKAIEAKQLLVAAAPAVLLTPLKVDIGDVRQGTRVPLEFRITNQGTGRLDYQMVPDCGCFSNMKPDGLEPGKSTSIKTIVNTMEYVGLQHHMLVLYSNDPKTPGIEVPVTFRATPAIRLYRPEGDGVTVPDGGATLTFLLTLPKDSKIHPVQWEFSGLTGKVTMKPWEGTAPDPDLNEGPMPRQGYKFEVKLTGNLIPGRTPGTLSVKTDDRDFGMVSYTVYAQKGIVALPEQVLFGEMSGHMRQSVLVSRPNKPFKILKVDSSHPHLTSVVSPVLGKSEYRVDLFYDGLAKEGDFLSVVKIHTDDPKQPLLEVTVRGTVR